MATSAVILCVDQRRCYMGISNLIGDGVRDLLKLCGE